MRYFGNGVEDVDVVNKLLSFTLGMYFVIYLRETELHTIQCRVVAVGK